MHPCVLILAILSLVPSSVLGAESPRYPSVDRDASVANSPAALGRMLFFDETLSEPAGQSCATCHDPERAFSDGRDNGVDGALSLGADGRSLGNRNAPTLTYAALVPPFQRAGGHLIGGYFADGRAATLAHQAREPFLNPLEMGQPSERAFADRVLGIPRYRHAIVPRNGTPDAVIDAVADAIAAFERSPELATFDSRYDRYLVGDYEMTREEAIGRQLFFSDLVNCIQCHLNEPGRISPRETFTSHRYHNIGVPANPSVQRGNGGIEPRVDTGLGENAALSPAERGAGRGKFRVPTLRNVAVTAPYMHNGVFHNLSTAVAFYARYPVPSELARINPETGKAWAAAEVPESIDEDLLSAGQPIDAERVRYLVAFLRTLTDTRYESLLPP
jgi:cytochrome c peroxidase